MGGPKNSSRFFHKLFQKTQMTFSVQFSRSVVSDSLRPYRLQHAIGNPIYLLFILPSFLIMNYPETDCWVKNYKSSSCLSKRSNFHDHSTHVYMEFHNNVTITLYCFGFLFKFNFKECKSMTCRVWFFKVFYCSCEVFILCWCRGYENLLGYRLLCTVACLDKMFIYTYRHNGDDNRIYLVGLLWGLNKLIHIKHLEGCLVHDNHWTYVTYYYCRCCYLEDK